MHWPVPPSFRESSSYRSWHRDQSSSFCRGFCSLVALPGNSSFLCRVCSLSSCSSRNSSACSQTACPHNSGLRQSELFSRCSSESSLFINVLIPGIFRRQKKRQWRYIFSALTLCKMLWNCLKIWRKDRMGRFDGLFFRWDIYPSLEGMLPVQTPSCQNSSVFIWIQVINDQNPAVRWPFRRSWRKSENKPVRKKGVLVRKTSNQRASG